MSRLVWVVFFLFFFLGEKGRKKLSEDLLLLGLHHLSRALPLCLAAVCIADLAAPRAGGEVLPCRRAGRSFTEPWLCWGAALGHIARLLVVSPLRGWCPLPAGGFAGQAGLVLPAPLGPRAAVLP